MAGVIEKQARRWTYEEYYRLDDDHRYEIIDGNLLMVPAPDVWHRDWIGDLYLLVRQFVTRNQLGRVFLSPLDVVLDTENTVQPDLVFVAKANTRIIQWRAIFGSPDLAVEILPPSGTSRDRRVKRDLYVRFGIKEYWIGDPGRRNLEILTLAGSEYRLHCRVREKGKLTSLVLPGLEFDVADIGNA